MRTHWGTSLLGMNVCASATGAGSGGGGAGAVLLPATKSAAGALRRHFAAAAALNSAGRTQRLVLACRPDMPALA